VHFDLPWSLMVFQQRNGRVDRYGQTRQPRIVYLFTETGVDRIKGDLRILEILQTKDEQATETSATRPHSCTCSIRRRKPPRWQRSWPPAPVRSNLKRRSMRRRRHPNKPGADADATMATGCSNCLPSRTRQAGGGHRTRPSTDFIREGISLFGDGELSSDYAFARTALQQLCIPTPIASFSHDDASQTITLNAPRDLQERLRVTLPLEVRDEHHRYALCAHKSRMAQAIEQARQAKADEESWPALHYLWPQHPIMDWLSDRVLTAFGRHRAPVIQCPQLIDGEQAFLLMGLIPNRKGQPC
jgi:hypothetical protein